MKSKKNNSMNYESSFINKYIHIQNHLSSNRTNIADKSEYRSTENGTQTVCLKAGRE